jgi:predicted acyl esterase
MYDRNPSTGANPASARATETSPATQVAFQTERYASRVALPVVPTP